MVVSLQIPRAATQLVTVILFTAAGGAQTRPRCRAHVQFASRQLGSNDNAPIIEE